MRRRLGVLAGRTEKAERDSPRGRKEEQASREDRQKLQMKCLLAFPGKTLSGDRPSKPSTGLRQ